MNKLVNQIINWKVFAVFLFIVIRPRFDVGSINFDDTKRIGYFKPGKSCLKVASQA